MGFLQALATEIAVRISESIAHEVIILLRKRTRMIELDEEADEIKKELALAESTAEREAILDKLHGLINGLTSI